MQTHHHHCHKVAARFDNAEEVEEVVRDRGHLFCFPPGVLQCVQLAEERATFRVLVRRHLQRQAIDVRQPVQQRTLFAAGATARRSALCFVLITSQAFLYNAIFFTYALVLTRFYEVPSAHTGIYLLPFAIGNRPHEVLSASAPMRAK